MRPISPDTVPASTPSFISRAKHCPGAGLPRRMARIRDSPYSATTHLAQALAQAKQKPWVFSQRVCDSAITVIAAMKCSRRQGSWLWIAADLRREWELATTSAVNAGIRTFKMRIGVIFAAARLPLQKNAHTIQAGRGAGSETARQWMSWVT